MAFVLAVGLLVAASFSAAALLKTTFAATVPTTLFAMTLVLYGFGLINALFAGFIVVVIASCLLVVFAIVRSAARSDSRTALRSARDLVSPALVVFLVLAFVTFVTTRDMKLSSFDEFTEWGAVVKAMVIDDKLSIYSPIDLAFRGYQPGIGLFEYFIERLGGWSEGNLFWAYQLVITSLFLPFVASLTWRKAGRLILILPIVVLVPSLFFPSTQIIIIDPLLGLLFGYCLALVYTSDPSNRRSTLHLTLALAMVVLTKDSGAYLAIVVLVALFAKRLHQRHHGSPGQWLRAALLPVGVPLAGAAVAYLSWKTIIAILHATPELSASNIDLVQLVVGPARPYWGQVVDRFWSSFLSEPLIVSHRLEISQTGMLLSGAALLTLLELWRRGRWGLPRDFSLAITFTVGGVVYAVGLLVLYLFKFSDYEAVRLASFVRYLTTYWAGGAMLMAASVIAALSEPRPVADSHLGRAGRVVSSPFGIALVWLVLIAILAPAKSLVAYVRDPVTATMSARSGYDNVLDRASAARIARGDRVWVVSEYDEGYDYWVLRFGLMPADVNPEAWTLGPPHGAGDVWTVDLSRREWASQLRRYDFVAIQKSSETFLSRYGALFVNEDDVVDGTLFKVTVVGNTVRLSRAP